MQVSPHDGGVRRMQVSPHDGGVRRMQVSPHDGGVRRMQVWHNPRCSKSRETMQLITDAGVEPEVRRYLDDPPSADELRRVLELLGMQPWELVRMGEDDAKALGLRDWGHDDPDRWIEAMASHPRLIERPVVVDGDRAVVGRPPSAVQDLL